MFQLRPYFPPDFSEQRFHNAPDAVCVPAPFDGVKMTAAEREREIAKLEKEMRAAAKQMEYEYAAVLRDRIIELRGKKD